jgi:hypothetical protein
VASIANRETGCRWKSSAAERHQAVINPIVFLRCTR